MRISRMLLELENKAHQSVKIQTFFFFFTDEHCYQYACNRLIKTF